MDRLKDSELPAALNGQIFLSASLASKQLQKASDGFQI
jgi:hypothetical protein